MAASKRTASNADSDTHAKPSQKRQKIERAGNEVDDEPQDDWRDIARRAREEMQRIRSESKPEEGVADQPAAVDGTGPAEDASSSSEEEEVVPRPYMTRTKIDPSAKDGVAPRVNHLK